VPDTVKGLREVKTVDDNIISYWKHGGYSLKEDCESSSCRVKRSEGKRSIKSSRSGGCQNSIDTETPKTSIKGHN